MTTLFDRRRFIAKSAGFTILGTAVGTAALGGALGASDPAAAGSGFRLFDATRFVGKPADLAFCGLQWLRVIYANEFWPTRTWDEPDLTYIETTLVPKLRAENHDRLVLDIEHWEADGVDKLVVIIRHLRMLLPGVRIGYYSLVPVREYWAFQPGREGRRIVYDQQNRQWDKLADAVDDLYPTLYAFYTDRDGWMRMADGTIAVAKAVGKPIYPFLWPQYHDKNEDISLQMVEPDFWLQQLDTVRNAGCDGAVIWGTLAPERRTAERKIARLSWDPAAPWWLQTQAFAKKVGLAGSGCG